MSEQPNDKNPLDAVRNCDEVLGQLYYFIDGYLDDRRRTQITGHLDNCGHCVDVFGFEAELRAVVARHAYEEVPPDLKQRIFLALSAEVVMNLTAKTSPFDRPSPFSGSGEQR